MSFLWGGGGVCLLLFFGFVCVCVCFQIGFLDVPEIICLIINIEKELVVCT